MVFFTNNKLKSCVCEVWIKFYVCEKSFDKRNSKVKLRVGEVQIVDPVTVCWLQMLPSFVENVFQNSSNVWKYLMTYNILAIKTKNVVQANFILKPVLVKFKLKRRKVNNKYILVTSIKSRLQDFWYSVIFSNTYMFIPLIAFKFK